MSEETKEMTKLETFQISVNAFLQKARRTDPRISQSSLAKMAAISPAALSSTLSGKYEGNVDEIIRKVNAVIEREQTKSERQIKKPSFVPTAVYEQMSYVMDVAQIDSQIVIFTGDAGIGKTMALTNYVKENPSAILIEVSPAWSLATLLEEIADKLGLEVRGRKDKLERAIITKLSGSDRMLIVDEAEYLPSKSLDILRRIHDKANVPVILAGMPRLIQNITGPNQKYRQISSRMYHVRLDHLKKEDSEAILSTVFDTIDHSLMDAFYSLSKGNARTLSKLIIMAQRTAIYNQTAVNTAVIKEASKMLIQD